MIRVSSLLTKMVQSASTRSTALNCNKVTSTWNLSSTPLYTSMRTSTKSTKANSTTSKIPNSALSLPGHLQLVDSQNGFGIQDVLSYLKTQKIAKCVVFDVSSTVIYTDYIIMLTCPSTRAMQTLSMRLVKLARSMDNKNKHLVGGGDDPDGLWNIIELGNITVHLMTEEGRASPVCQRVERRLMQNATLIPVPQWHTLRDAWAIRRERLEQNPPPQLDGTPPPGYYSRGADKAIPMDMEVVSDPDDDEFDYLHVEDDHEAKVTKLEKQALYPGAAAESESMSSQTGGIIDVISSGTTIVSPEAQQFLENSILNDSDSEYSDVDSTAELSDDDIEAQR